MQVILIAKHFLGKNKTLKSKKFNKHIYRDKRNLWSVKNNKIFEINKMTTVEKPYKLSLIEAPIPPSIKAVAMKKVNMLSMMDPCSGDYYKNPSIGRVVVSKKNRGKEVG